MALTILDDPASIKAAIATMHPIASEAAQLLAHRVFEAPHLFNNGKLLTEECIQACAISARRAGMEDLQAFKTFMENHGQSVANVAVSIVLYTIRSQQRRQRWGWFGKAAAVAAGVAIGAFFG